MKEFWKSHSYDMVKMFLNQFATAIFGFALVIAVGKSRSIVLRNIISVFAILFYLFLLYTMTWEIGFNDRIPVEHGKMKRNVCKGMLISLCANGINFILALFVMLGYLITEVPFFQSMGGVCGSIAVVIEGMYTGVLANHVGGAALNSYWFMYFLIPLPAILTCGLSYYLGLKDIKFTGLFNHVYPESDREPKRKK